MPFVGCGRMLLGDPLPDWCQALYDLADDQFFYLQRLPEVASIAAGYLAILAIALSGWRIRPGPPPRRVLGVDGVKDRWVAVELIDGAFGRAFVIDRLADLLAEPAEAIGVDVPIGLAERGFRQADLEGRLLVGERRSSVFMTPPRPVLELPTFEAALVVARELLGGVGISRQAFALFPKILEAEAARAADPRIFEVHPEVSFGAVAGTPMRHPKRTWNGLHERRAALAEVGIAIPERLDGPVGLVPPDDLLDAAVAAWSADRMARGLARSIPDQGEVEPGAEGRIWA
jgi:predicted RNase H-like nuclease